MTVDEFCNESRIDDARVKKIREQLLPDVAIDRLAETFKVLSDPTRVKIVFSLLGGELCVCEISEVIGMSQSAVSHQLRKLKDHRLVKRRKSANMVYYALDDDHIIKLLNQGIQHVQEEFPSRMSLPVLDTIE